MQLSAVLAMGLAVLPSVVVAGYNNPHGLGFTCQDNVGVLLLPTSVPLTHSLLVSP